VVTLILKWRLQRELSLAGPQTFLVMFKTMTENLNLSRRLFKQFQSTYQRKCHLSRPNLFLVNSLPNNLHWDLVNWFRRRMILKLYRFHIWLLPGEVNKYKLHILLSSRTSSMRRDSKVYYKNLLQVVKGSLVRGMMSSLRILLHQIRLKKKCLICMLTGISKWSNRLTMRSKICRQSLLKRNMIWWNFSLMKSLKIRQENRWPKIKQIHQAITHSRKSRLMIFKTPLTIYWN